MRRILLSAAMIVFVVAAIVGGTGAFFSDTETSTGNVFAAGALDLKIDNESYYNGLVCAEVDEGEYEWQQTTWGEANMAQHFDPYMTNLIGTPCVTSWALKDLGEGDLFFDFEDVKPGDWGEDTISIHVHDNPAWACMDMRIQEDDFGANDLALQEQIQFIWWADDGDNVLEADEYDSLQIANGPAIEVLNSYYALADSETNVWDPNAPGTPLLGGVDPETQEENVYYVAKAWCFGEFEFGDNLAEQDGEGKTGQNGPGDRGPGFVCNGASTGNDAMAGRFLVDVAFEAVQARHNGNFQCGPIFDEDEPVDPVVVLSPVLNFGPTGWGGWSCPADHTAISGQVLGNSEVIGAEGLAIPSATIGGETYPSFPHYTFADGETGYVMQNGGIGQSVQIEITCQPN